MLRRIVDIHPQAIAEAREAREHYSSKSGVVEEEFRAELEHAVRMIRDYPKTWPNYLHGTRRFLMRRFPYTVVYRTDGTNSLILAVAHA